jgi:peptidoglycan/xylan/chitin deacetylase (PgdA/CDA1 family)
MRRLLAAGWMGLFFLLAAAARGAGPPGDSVAGRRIAVVFRYDDFSARSDTSLEERILRTFRDRKLRCTVAVIPLIARRSVYDPSPQERDPLPVGKAGLLRAAIRDGTVEAAQHGLSHQARRGGIRELLPGSIAPLESELAGATRAAQVREIARGKRVLEEVIGSPVETFVPPWNRYDGDTLFAAEKLGFKVFSAGLSGAARSESSLRLLPATTSLSGLAAAVAKARSLADPAPIIVVLFHSFDFRESGSSRARLDLAGFERTLDWVSRQRDLNVMTLGDAAESAGDLGAARLRWNRVAPLRVLLPFLPAPWLPADSRSVYLTARSARSAGCRLLAAILTGYGAAALCAALLVRRLVPRRRTHRKLHPPGEGRAASPEAARNL